MREMKDSGVKWIGKIPRDWEQKKIKYASTRNTAVLPETTDEGEIINYIDIGSVSYVDGITQIQKFHFKNAPSRARRILHADDTIISTVRTYLKAVAYIEPCYNLYIASTGFSVIRPNNCVCGKFLYYSLSSHTFISSVEANSVGISYPAITNAALINLKTVFPPIEVQHRIAEYLDNKCSKIDAIIAGEQAIIEKLKEYKSSVITETVTKGLNPDGPMKDSGVEWIGEVPENWVIRRFKNLGICRNGLTYSPADLCDETEGTLVLRSSNIQNGVLDYKDTVYVNCDINPNIMVKDGDILICSRNGSAKLIGKNALISKDIHAAFGAFMMIYRCECPRYLRYVLSSKVFSYNLATFLTSTVNQLTVGNFMNIKFCFTKNLDEQNQIVDYLDRKCTGIDSAIAKKQTLIEKLTAYKKALIYEVVTGKKEV